MGDRRHGSGARNQLHQSGGTTTAIDPVCKMEVDEANPTGGKTEHQGVTYYFCAPGCKRVFERDPDKYLGGS